MVANFEKFALQWKGTVWVPLQPILSTVGKDSVMTVIKFRIWRFRVSILKIDYVRKPQRCKRCGRRCSRH